MDKKATLEFLGTRIREIRKKQGLSQTQLANNIGKDQQSIQRLEAGKINPSFFYLCQIADGLGVTVASIVKFRQPLT